MGLFEKKDKNIVVLKKTRPGECGGTDSTLDKNAPKEIKSNEITLFEVRSSCVTVANPQERKDRPPIDYIYAFAAPAGDSTLLYRVTRAVPFRFSEPEKTLAFVKGDLTAELAELVRELDLAKKNGFHSKTHGLPENFGGWVRILYASGENIDFSDNRSPIMSRSDMMRIDEVFDGLLTGEKIVPPLTSDIVRIDYGESRSGDSYLKSSFTPIGDGTGIRSSEACFDGSQVFKSEKTLDAETVKKAMKIIEEKQLLLWDRLPGEVPEYDKDKLLTFVMKDGRKIRVQKSGSLPQDVSGGFFDVCLELFH